MNLSEQVHKVLAYIQDIEVPAILDPAEAGRIFYRKFIPLSGEKEDIFLVEERTLLNDNNAIQLRVYRPNNKEILPVIIYFHGGWFNAGSLDTHDIPLRQLTNRMEAVIISVDYRLAPEYPFPAGLNDCEFALQWVIDHASEVKINADSIILAGDSAGAALAATLSRKFRQQIVAQLLIYPVTDNSLNTPSWTEFQHGPLLDLEGAIKAWEWYLPTSEHQTNPDAVPLLADDLEGLPPTFVAVAELDPLKDEAIQYVEKLMANRVNVKSKLYKGTIHGFFQMGGFIDDAKILMEDMVNFLKTEKVLK